jgi:transposase
LWVDTSKRFFQLHGVDAEDRPALRRQLTRAQALPFFEKLAPTLVAMEACGDTSLGSRVDAARARGATVRAAARQALCARGKNDAADAAALCEAASGPHMRFVPAKSTDEQAALMLAGQRERG